MTYTYYPKGVCTTKYEIKIEDGLITDLCIDQGCDGNLQGIIRLVKGQRADEMAALLQGIHCGNKSTSCPDQLSRALEKAVEEERRRSDDI